MYCPRCNQLQISEEMKYCSRCGFSLEVIAEVLSNDGSLPQLYNSEKRKKSFIRNLSTVQIHFGLAVLTVFLIFLAAVSDASEEVVIALFGFGGGILVSLLINFFADNQRKSSSEKSAPQSLDGKRDNKSLPPQTSQPIYSYAPPSAGTWKSPFTADLVPYSVTDNTTKSLHED